DSEPDCGLSFSIRLGWGTRLPGPTAELVKATKQLRDFYSLLEMQAERFGMRRLGECTGQMDWPDRGVFFLLDPDEPRGRTLVPPEGAGHRSKSANEATLPRVVALGTHSLKPRASSTLWKR